MNKVAEFEDSYTMVELLSVQPLDVNKMILQTSEVKIALRNPQ